MSRTAAAPEARTQTSRDPPPGPADAFLDLPAGVDEPCVIAWRTFVSHPDRSRELAARAFASESPTPSRIWGGLCLAYHLTRGGETDAAARTLAAARAMAGRSSQHARARMFADVLDAYLDVVRGEAERAVPALERAVEAGARAGLSHPLDRFLSSHVLALAYGRLGRLEQVLHHHYANLLMLERCGSPSPLAVVLLNLSSTLTAIDDWEEALELAQRAVGCCKGMENAALERRAQINVALALRFLGRVDEAIALLGRLERQRYRDRGSDFALHINYAEALAHRGDVAGAARQLGHARECAAPSGDTHERANLEWIAGFIAARSGEVADAIERLETAKRETLALRKLHVPLLPRIVEVLASCYARSGDLERAFETFRQFHDTFEARLGYTTRARYTGRLSRTGAVAIADALHGPVADIATLAAEHTRMSEALRRTLASGSGAEGLPRWSAGTIARIDAEARGLGVESQYIGGLVQSLRHAAEAANLESPMQAVRVRVLGEFEVEIGGKALTFGRKRPERPLALLRYLAASSSRSVAEAQVADALWADLEGDAALRALAVNLHRLRQLLGDSTAIIHQGRRLALDMRRVWCDAILFEGLLDRAAAATDDEERTAMAGRAIALYRGDLGHDEDRERWAIAAARRLRSRFLGACAALGSRLAATRRWAEASASFARGLELDPLGEELCLGLMRGSIALGRREAGIAAYRRHAEALAASGAGTPAAAIEALHRELLAGAR